MNDAPDSYSKGFVRCTRHVLVYVAKSANQNPQSPTTDPWAIAIARDVWTPFERPQKYSLNFKHGKREFSPGLISSEIPQTTSADRKLLKPDERRLVVEIKKF